MLCDICKTNEATVHLTQIVEGKMRKIDLCESCAESKNVSAFPDFSIADLMLGLGAAEGMQTEAAGGRCPFCGLTQADFKKTGRLGCGTCWSTFAQGLSILLRDIHRGTSHIGKVPLRSLRSKEMTERARLLEQELQKAIAQERYEDAALIRDEIRRLESSATGTSS